MSGAWRFGPNMPLMTSDDASHPANAQPPSASVTREPVNQSEGSPQPEDDPRSGEPTAGDPDAASAAEGVGEPGSPEEAAQAPPPHSAAAPTSRSEARKRAKRQGPGPAKTSAEAPEAEADPDGYRVNLPNFEGPLDLLLHLVRKHELDILDIPIAFVTEKYTEYVQMMQDLNIDTASEYLVMAATLIHIKSRMLLPDPPAEEADEGSDDPEDDPRAELVRRLLEYQKYKDVAEHLGTRSFLGRDVFPRGSAPEVAAGPAPLMQVSVFKLLDAFQDVLTRTHLTQEHEIDFERISISDKIGQLGELLRRAGRVPFTGLFSRDAGRAELIITFLAILEMTKLRMTRLFQAGPLDEIYVELAVSDDDDEGSPDPFADYPPPDEADD